MILGLGIIYNINGEFIVDKMTIPLSFKKTMNITATRAVSSIV